MHHPIPLFLALRLSVRRFQIPLEGLSFVKTLATFGLVGDPQCLFAFLTQVTHLTAVKMLKNSMDCKIFARTFLSVHLLSRWMLSHLRIG